MKKTSGLIIPAHRVSKFLGLNTEFADIRAIPDGVTPDAINWITGTEKDHIELRRGTALLGQTRNDGAGKITGLGVGTRNDGTQVPFFSYGRKVKYYDSTMDDTVEVSLGGSTPVLPAEADGEEVSIAPYQNLAGDFIYLSSPNSSIYKIPVANPGSAVDISSTTYRGVLKFGQSRSILIQRKGTNGFIDNTGLYMSYVDKVNLSSYTQVTAEAVGASGSTHYTHTTAVIGSGKTIFQFVLSATVAAGTETFLDDKNGNLVSNYGGTGTINYATGAVDVTFSDTTTGAVTCSYYWEYAGTAGVADFSFSGSRTPGQGRYFQQFDGGGTLNAVYPLADIFYSFHKTKTWQTRVPSDDDDTGPEPASNLPFREKMGVSHPRSAFGSTTGIYYINNAIPEAPEVYVLRLYTGATAANIAAPDLISQALNLSSMAFDYAVVRDWGIYVLVACQQIRNGTADAFNSRMFLYNKNAKVWDLVDYPASCLEEYNGTLIAGDPVTNNVFTLFSGLDDDGSIIPNYWTSGQTNHGVEGQKVCSRMVLDGLIQSAQTVEVDISLDGGNWVNVFTVDGDASYVDSGASIAVGSYTVGSKIAGGGATVYANPFQVEFPLNTDRYEYIRVRFRATGGGYCAINFYEWKSIRIKAQRAMPSRQASS